MCTVQWEDSDLRDLHQHICRLQALFLKGVRRLEKDQDFVSDGYQSARAWLHHELRLSPNQVERALCSARAMDSLPLASQALAEGAISLDHFSLIARAIERAQLDAVEPADRILTECAKAVDTQTLARGARALVITTRPDQAAEDYEKLFNRRMLRVSQAADGMVLIEGQLDQESGAILETALGQLMPPPAKEDRRTTTQRRADALTELARRALQRKELGTSGGQRPHIVLSGRSLDETIFELMGKGPVPRPAAERIACDASVSEGGRETRRISPQLRRQVEHRDRHCVQPGCDAPPSWCDVHHIEHWLHGGPTVLENLELRCRRHHRQAHAPPSRFG